MDLEKLRFPQIQVDLRVQFLDVSGVHPWLVNLVAAQFVLQMSQVVRGVNAAQVGVASVSSQL